MQIGTPHSRSTAGSVHLDALRGGAALVVLLGHVWGLFFAPLHHVASSVSALPPADDGHLRIGDAAVMVFFVLSGYLVGGSVARDVASKKWSWTRYFLERLTRLWIVLIPALILGASLDFTGVHLFPQPTALYAGPPSQAEVPHVAERLSLPTIAGNAVFLQLIRVDTLGSNNSLWSLANEFWYYLAFPLLWVAISDGQSNLRRVFYLLLLVGILLFIGKDVCKLFPIWLLGVGIARLPRVEGQKLARLFASALATALPVILGTARHFRLSRYLGEWLVALACAGCLYFVMCQTWPSRRSLYTRASGFFAEMSYSLYLIHLPLAVFLCACLNNPWHPWAKSAGSLAAFALINVALIAAAFVFYRLFEVQTHRTQRFLLGRLSPQSSGQPELTRR